MTFFKSDFEGFLFADAGAFLLQDVKRWAAWRPRDVTNRAAVLETVQHFFINHVEFRSLIDFRIRQSNPQTPIVVLKDYPRANDLYLYADIGPGMIIQHGHSTWVLAEKVGANFFVNQNVTVGVDKGGKPTIGDNVQVRAGAVVVGPITIGNNVTIAPNSFVNFDVADDMVVFPAKSVCVPKKKKA